MQIGFGEGSAPRTSPWRVRQRLFRQHRRFSSRTTGSNPPSSRYKAKMARTRTASFGLTTRRTLAKVQIIPLPSSNGRSSPSTRATRSPPRAARGSGPGECPCWVIPASPSPGARVHLRGPGLSDPVCGRQSRYRIALQRLRLLPPAQQGGRLMNKPSKGAAEQDYPLRHLRGSVPKAASTRRSTPWDSANAKRRKPISPASATKAGSACPSATTMAASPEPIWTGPP